LLINKAIYADIQRYIYAKVENLPFCDYACVFHYLSTATGWGLLSRANSFDVEDEISYLQDVVHHGDALLSATASFNERIKTLHPEDGTTAEWEAEVVNYSWYQRADIGDQPNWKLVMMKKK
jgi:hypothetical protein